MLMGATRIGSTFTDLNWGELDFEWGGGAGGGAPSLTLRAHSIREGGRATHLTATLPLSALSAAPGEGMEALPPAMRADVLACAESDPARGMSPACVRFMAACTPALSTANQAHYWLGHIVGISGLLVVVLGILLSPCIAWVVGPLLPGGRLTAFAIVGMGIAVIWSFIQSMH